MLDTVIQIRVSRRERKLINKLAKSRNMKTSTMTRQLLMQEVTHSAEVNYDLHQVNFVMSKKFVKMLMSNNGVALLNVEITE